MKNHSLFCLTVLLAMACQTNSQVINPSAPLASFREVIRNGNTRALRQWLAKDEQLVHRQDAQGNTLLIHAAFYGRPEDVKMLLERGADPNATNKVGATPLIRAATDHAKVVLLLRHGAHVDARSELGNTALLLAARRYGSAKTIRMLLEHGADVEARNRYGNTALMSATAAADYEMVTILVEQGADVNAEPDMSYPGDPIWNGLRTPLMWAALRGDIRIAKYLLEHGAKVDGSAGFGTPLTQAVWGESVEMLRFLVDQGAAVDLTVPNTEYTALHWAASSERAATNLVQVLLSHGANPNAEGGQPIDAFLGVPQTPLKLARQRGATPVVDALLRAGAKEWPETAAEPRAGRDSDSGAGTRSVREAFAMALPRLQHTAAFSKEAFLRHGSRQNCLSCHQQYLPMAAVGLARRRGLSVDQAAAAAQIELASCFHGDEELNQEALFHPEPSIGHGYALLGLNAEAQRPGIVSDIMTHHLAVIQLEDGHWPLNILRPPIQSSVVSATALSVFALSRYGWPARADEFNRAVDKARRWLWKVEPGFHEERVFQLLGLAWSGESPRRLRKLAQALIEEQRENGCWAQLPGLAADAYATGQALYALQEAASASVEDPAIRRGRDYLLRTQLSDGTWHVRRRAFPFQPTIDSGFPHGRDAWISAMATSWALLALVPAVEPDGIAGHETATRGVAAIAPSVVAEPTGDVALVKEHATPVDFVRDIQPLFQRSCLACHSGEKAKSNYRLETRHDLLATGKQGEASVRVGQGSSSPLVHYIAGTVADMEMPPLGMRDKHPGLSAEEVSSIRRWIDAGALWPDNVRLSPAAHD